MDQTDPFSRAGRCPPPAWRETGLLLVGHGSESLEGAGDGLIAHAARIRAAGLFGGGVEAGFLNGEPALAGALARLEAATVYVVPFFMGEGYFTRVAVPRRLGDAAAELGRDTRLLLCAPVGCNERLQTLLVTRARQACRRNGLVPGTTALILMGHGNPHSAESSEMLRRHATAIAGMRRFAEVRTGFIEEAPFLEETLSSLSARNAVAIAVLAGEGRHAREDVPAVITADEARRKAEGGRSMLAYTGIIGADAAMVPLILDQVQGLEAKAGGTATERGYATSAA